MARKDQKTSSNRPTVSDALTLDELDTVVGGAAAAVNPTKPNELLGPMTETVIPVIDHTQATVAAASAQLASGAVDAAHAIAQVGNYDTAHNIAHVTGLTDLVNASHNPEVAAALTQSLHTGEAEKNLANLVASGQMQAGDALAALQKATDALAHMPDTTKAITDGLFETSVAHLHAAATAAGNTNLSSYIESFHGFDLKSGRVEIAADQAAHAVVQGVLTIENAIAQTISMATSQGLPKDVALTALLIDTNGHATVADQLAKYVNTGAQGAWDHTQFVKDATDALVKDTLTAGQIVETLRESVDALALYAPSKIIGTADINFAESIADLNSKVGDAHADMRSYIQTNLALDLAIGTVCNDVKYQFQAGMQNAASLANFAFQDAQRNGLPGDIGYIAALAHLPQGTAEATKIANTLADHINTSQWTAASPFVREMQDLLAASTIYKNGTNFTVDKAAELIHMSVDTLARYAPTRIEGTPVMHAAEVMFQLTWGGPSNVGAAIKAELIDKFPYEMKLGEVLNAAQWGVTNLDVNRAITDTQNWTDRDAIPRVYGLMAAIGDHTVANANLVAQKLSDGLNNGSLEQDIVNLVKAGKITAEQGVTAIEESINVLARFNKVPFGMPVDVARAYVFDKLADLATAQNVTGLASYMKLNFLDDIKVGDQVQSYITGHAGTIGAAAEWAGFVANSHINLVISNGLATGDLSIKAIMDAEKLTGQQAEQLLFTAASTGKVAISIVVGELEALRNAANPAIAVTDMITHLGTAIKANTINDDVAVQLIAGLASYSTAAAQGAHDTFDALIKSGDLKAQQVLNDTYNAITSHALNDAQALKALAIMAGSGVEDLRNGATSMFGSLVQAGHVEVKAAIDALHSIPATLLTPVQCVGALFSLVSVSKLTDQLVVAADLAKMTGVDVINALHGAVTTAHTISANAALTVLAGMASANAAMQTAVNAELVALVKASQITADAAMTALTTLAAGNTALLNIVSSEVTALVTAGVSTAAHAVDVLGRLGAGATDVTQKVIGEEIAALITAGKITGQTVATQLCGLLSTGAPALRSFVGEELANLVSRNCITAQAACNSLRTAFNNQVTPAFWTAFSAMTGEGNAALQSAAQIFILPFLQAGNGVASAMSSIDSAVASGAINAHQAVVTLGCLAQSLGNDARAIAPIATEFGALVHRGAINANDAMLDLIHAAGKPPVQLLVTLANNEKAMLAGMGEALATYATEAKQTSTQIFNLLTANAPYVSGYGTRALTDSTQLLAISLGIAAQATGDLQTAAQNVVSSFLTSGQSGLRDLNNYSPWSYSYSYAEKLDPSQVISMVVDAGMHADAAVRTAALNALGAMADRSAGWGQAFNGVDLLKQINTAAGKTADGLKFVGDAAMQLLNHNANPQPILDYITGSTSSYVQRSWSFSSGWGDEVSDFGGSGYKTVRNFAEGDALNMLSQIAGGASAAMRDLIANEILTSNIAGTPAALKTFMTNHLGDGLAEAIMAKQVASGVLSAANAITTLNGLVADYMKSHATEDLNVVKNVAMAHLDLAVHAAISSVENAAAKAQTDVWNWGNNAQKMIVPAGLTALQGLINTPANLQQVLTGLGMLQMAQSTAVGMADIVNMAHVAIIDFTMASAHGTQALAEKAASQASSFFTNGFDLLAANWTVAGIIKNEVIAHPENYQSWVNLGSRLAGSSMASELGSQIIGGKWEYRAVNLGSGMLAAAFENDAVIHALGKDQAQTLSSACRIVSLGCSGLTNAFSGVVNIGAGNAITASTALFNTFSDINSGRNASASAQTFGNASLALFTGASATDLRNAGSNFGSMWGSIFTGGDVKGDANNFGNDMQKALYSNNQYMEMVSNQAQASANAIANAGNKLGGAITNVANTVGNGIVGAANTVAQVFSSY